MFLYYKITLHSIFLYIITGNSDGFYITSPFITPGNVSSLLDVLVTQFFMVNFGQENS
ncbi:hypothetical protein RhiirA5_348553 [Rhizophagus irregularis]|uniref:Uncharacterized protein n=1 Tax=Rhizophagus irregularis TaxID=588596 RepID=A0A2N0Q9V0_9GLOM|nr:hypothetical protein RhiirA5_348553 [Rhizophagus irregularis]